MYIAVFGSGALGRAVEIAASRLGHAVVIFGRPSSGRHIASLLRGVDVVVDASQSNAVLPNMQVALTAGCRRIVVATTGWSDHMPAVEALLRERKAAAVASEDFGLGLVRSLRSGIPTADLYRLLATVATCSAAWGRVLARDRDGAPDAPDMLAQRANDRGRSPVHTRPPSISQARDDLGARPVQVAAYIGMSGFSSEASGATDEPLLAVREEFVCAAGILAAAAWLAKEPRRCGVHLFDSMAEELVQQCAEPAADGHLSCIGDSGPRNSTG